MADEWDNLIPDSRDMPTNSGSFGDKLQDNSNRKSELNSKPIARKKKVRSSASSEQMSDEQDDYNATELVMEYTDIFEASTQQKLDFIDIQENDAISEASDDEIVAHSTAGQTYEHTAPVDSEDDSEDQSRLPPADTQMDTYGIDVDLGMNNGLAGYGEEYDDDLLVDDGSHGTLSDNIETRLGNVEIEENGNEKNEQIEAQELETEGKHSKVSKVESEIKKVENMKSENKEEVYIKSERSQEAQKVDEEIRNEEKEGCEVEDEKSEGEELEEQAEIIVEDDYSDDTTEVDKLLKENSAKVYHQKPKRKMVGSGTPSHEVEPLLSTSQSHSPEPLETPGTRRHFTPREHPGKAVKSVAIGTDDDYPSDEYSKERHQKANPGAYKKRNKASTGKTPPQQNFENGVKTSKKAGTLSSTRTSKSSQFNRQVNGDALSNRSSKQTQGERGSLSSDAIFFKSRLPQTSRRRPKRHVWLVRDSEIHRLIAEKASILRRYEEEGVTGKQKFKGFPNYSEVDILGLPSVGFSGRTKDDSHRSSLPYGRHPSSRTSQGDYHARSSSEDDDEKTNRMGTKAAKSGTFAVGLAARREQAEGSKQHEPGDEEEGCELCAAEAREKEKHEKKLKELEAAAKAGPHHPRNLMMGIVYSAKFLGSTNLMSPAAPNKAVRLQQAQEAIGRIKVPEGEEQPSSDVDLFISTERIKIVSSENKQPLTNHHLKTISFIADIGNIIVVMARLSTENDNKEWSGKMPDFSQHKEKQEAKTTKVVCHVLETTEAQTVAKTVGQAFSIAYHEFLKANRLNLSEIEDMEYNGILEQQKILGEELSLLADESKTKEVVIHKKNGESLLLMIVESGWGSMIPTVLIAHMDNRGPAAKSGQLNVGNQILAVNGQSLVGLPLLECQNIIKAQKYEERVSIKVVNCPPSVEISINRPDTKYQLGFSVQNGMICSLMRGGIAERGGVRVGHKIIELNGESVVAASHHHIVEILQTTIGELQMKTMPITLYKLLVGLELPQYL